MSRLEAENARFRDLAELAVIACVPLLPLRGASGNYELESQVSPTLRALPQEWAEAAYCIAELDKAVERGRAALPRQSVLREGEPCECCGHVPADPHSGLCEQYLWGPPPTRSENEEIDRMDNEVDR